jgi:thioredoxin-like negative regulator of GroEL
MNRPIHSLAVVAASLLFVHPLCFAERVKPVTGSYKQALRKAGEQGKPLLVDFYTDWCGYCKKLDKQIEEIAGTVNKFAYYKVNAEQNRALAKEFGVRGYPTVVIVKPDGSEVHRWSGCPQSADALRQRLEGVLDKAGPIEATVPPAKPAGAGAAMAGKSPAETAAANELKTAEMYLKVGRQTDGIRALRQLTTKYPGTEAANAAQEKLDELDGRAR